MTLQQLKKEAIEEFDDKFCTFLGRKLYVSDNIYDTSDKKLSLNTDKAYEIKDFIDSLITKAYEEGKSAFIEDGKTIYDHKGEMIGYLEVERVIKFKNI